MSHPSNTSLVAAATAVTAMREQLQVAAEEIKAEDRSTAPLPTLPVVPPDVPVS